jgi:hypothetical protein
VKYHYGDRSSTYSVRPSTAVASRRCRFLASRAGALSPGPIGSEDIAGGEFDWGGTSVK